MGFARVISVKGRVQGVGFRPFIFSLADEHQVLGTVQNNMDGVKIFAESESFEKLQAFCLEIKTKAPRLSKISEFSYSEADFTGFKDFTIIPSDDSGSSKSLVIPIDAAVCDDCISEMRDPENFRFNYSFINCTQCGPRYTIISDLPYDRPYTSMQEFPMCENFGSKQEEGVVSLRFPAEDVVSYLFALGDGVALQVLSDKTRDSAGTFAVGVATARYLFGAE